MAVNGTELAVGQKWRNRKGDSVIIESFQADDSLCWNLSDGSRVNDRGAFWEGGTEDEDDLVEFLLCAPEVSAAHSFNALNLFAPVGDLASTAKGSGARFNAGKPAFELVPLRLVAESYRRCGRMTKAQENIVEAMFRLADFQERGKDNLLSIAILLGIESWDDCAKAFDYGQGKYVAWNWAKGMPWSVPIACAARHLLAMLRGEVDDLESKVAHRGHVMCNIVMLVTYERTFPEGDDRAPAGYLAPLLEAA